MTARRSSAQHPGEGRGDNGDRGDYQKCFHHSTGQPSAPTATLNRSSGTKKER
jgi:hypothetical protein